MMVQNEEVKKLILETIRNQIRQNSPEETKLTYERLTGLGYNEEDSLSLIAMCFAIEIYDVVNRKTPYNQKRYIRNMSRLPDVPGDIE